MSSNKVKFFRKKDNSKYDQKTLQLLYANEYKHNKTKRARMFSDSLAVWTRLELATSCVTGRHSNQAELPDQNMLRTLFYQKRGAKLM